MRRSSFRPSRGARSYANDIMLAKMIEALAQIYPQIPLCMHQDHGNNEATCLSAIRHGFTSVMMDGCLMGGCQDACQLRLQRRHHRPRVARMAHWVGASVEGELGVLGRWKPAKARPRMATAPKASWTIPCC